MYPNPEEINDVLTRAGLNWTVRSEEVMTSSGIILPDKIAIVREDKNIVLGDHSSGYVAFQNYELLDLLYQISNKTGLTLHTGGSFGDGRKVWFQLKSDDLRLGNDKIEGYISGFNSFDGSTSLSFGNSNKTVSCQNTFWLVYRSMQTKMKHSLNMRPKIDEILRNIDRLVVEEKDNFQRIKHMSEMEMSIEIKNLVIEKLFDLSKEEKLDSSVISTNKRNKMDRFYIDMNGELKQKGENLWGLFSSVTKYTTHSMKKTDNTESKIFGGVGNKEREIWHMLADVV